MNRKSALSVFTTGRSMTMSSSEGEVRREFLRDSYKQKEASAKETLRTRLESDIVFTETWTEVEYERELEEEELMEGEVSASVFKVGCYTVRMAY